ncbi:MAG: hypothetical protein M1826_005019 [Phylliscum demangeonii]|nr:MAG: hypothetical protein M1826_005019 [Phylliscum demangeonii]
MARLLRGRPAGMQADLSSGILPEFFALDEFARYGINSQISTVAYDPVQSLLAVGVTESGYGHGQVYVFGQKRVAATFSLPRKASVKRLQFTADRLLVMDSKDQLLLYSLETRRLLATHAFPSTVAAVVTDASLDWALIGLQSGKWFDQAQPGEVMIYDLDRHGLAPLKLPNFWRERAPKSRLVPVVALALHPRDVGKLLIGYREGAVVYSFKQNKVVLDFRYELPPGAPGGRPDPRSIQSSRYPALTHALWHPTGMFVLTAHEDSSIVVWDLRDGRVVLARTVQENHVNRPSAGAASALRAHTPIVQLAWCSKDKADDTGLLIAGGASVELPSNTLTYLDLGMSPNYATSSWQLLADHFAHPKRQHMLPMPPDAPIHSFCLLPRSSPYYAGSHDPVAILVVLTSGELLTLSFPEGQPIPIANRLHISLSFVHPFAHRVDFATVERATWLGMKEARQRGPALIRGGAEASHPRKRFERRTILHTSHRDGSVRIWDAGHGDEIGNEDTIQVEVAPVLGRFEDVESSAVSMAGATGELAVGLTTGEVVVFRWGRNRHCGRKAWRAPLPPEADGLADIADRADPSLEEGLLPHTLYRCRQGAVTAIKMSDVGFLAVGYASGQIVILDMRGPAVIFDVNVKRQAKPGKRSSVLRHPVDNANPTPAEWATVLEFGILSLEGDDYSSILCFAGTNLGRVTSIKLLPDATTSGRYTAQDAGCTWMDDGGLVMTLTPLNIDTGASAHATPAAASGLREGRKVNGVLVVASPSGARIFRPAAAKATAHKTWDNNVRCQAAAVVDFEEQRHVLVAVFGDGSARAYSLPALKGLAVARLGDGVEMARLSDALVTASGDLFLWAGPSELAVFHVWGSGQALPKSKDQLFNPDLVLPARPVISNLQWISGSQAVSAADLDLLVGGPDRPMSRRMMEQERADEHQRRILELEGRSVPVSTRSTGTGTGANRGLPADASSDEGYWAYMQRAVNERVEKLGMAGDSMEHLREQSAGWATDVNKYVKQQKRNAVLGLLKGKLGY